MHMGLRSALFGSALPLAGFELALDFRAGWYRSGAVVTRDPAALPGYSFGVRGPKFEPVGGALSAVAANVPAIIPGVGYIARPAYRNAVPNSTFAGATADTMPAPWALQPQSGQGGGHSLTVVGTGLIDGQRYVDLRFVFGGQQTQRVYSSIRMGGSGTWQAGVQGEVFTSTVLAALIAGEHPVGLSIQTREHGSADEYLQNANFGMRDMTSTPKRYTSTAALKNANTVKALWNIECYADAGQALDFTIRIMVPSFGKHAVFGPYIATTNAGIEIVDDDMRITGPVPDDADWVGIVSATLPDAASSPATPIGLVFIGNPAGGGNYLYVGRQPSGASGGIFATVSSGGPNVATVNSNIAHAAGGRHVIAFGRRANRYFILGRNPAGAIGTMVTMPTDQPMPVGLGRIQPGRRDVAGAAINGPLEFLGWRRIPPGFSDDQVRGMLVALA